MRQGSVRRGGFTLVELLVVIGIIAILAAIILPVYSNTQQRARQAQCQSNLSALAIAMKTYYGTYKGYPLGALDPYYKELPSSPNYSPGLKDDAGNAAYTAAAYNTYSTVTGRRSRIGSLFPNYIEEQKGLICPDEDQDTHLITGTDPAGALNGGDSTTLLEVGGNAGTNFAVSTYDDYYNVFGYHNGSANGIALGPGTPRIATGEQVGGGRKAPRLNNRYAPGQTILTYCREHEVNYDKQAEDDPRAAISLGVRLSGTAERLVRGEYDWDTQAETLHE